ncbi:MAG: restriction endonuclease subunit S [Planctomycetota bacterium]|nr:restriction endonuclease subunit S [Planctomycetota bacterium]
MRSKMSKIGDTIITTKGNSTGRTSFVTDRLLPFVYSPHLSYWRSRAPEKLFSGFLRYWSQGVEFIEQLSAMKVSTDMAPYLSLTDQRRLSITLPSLAEQKAIAGVLGALDDKIELNRRMNATLESMARALFQSWFVDFDPVRAKLDGRQPVGMDEATAALFPNSFQDSELGPIPKGWRVAVLDELIKFVIGGDWGATAPTDDETISCYCIRGADIPSLQSGGVGKMPTRFLKRSSVEKRKLEHGDLAIEISGGSPTQSTGRPVLASDALLQSLGRPLVASNFCRIVKLKSPAHSKFVYLWLRRLYDTGELLQFENGTTGIKNFAFVIFSERYLLVVPDLRVSEAFDRADPTRLAAAEAAERGVEC